jgi:hypothetical protein
MHLTIDLSVVSCSLLKSLGLLLEVLLCIVTVTNADFSVNVEVEFSSPSAFNMHVDLAARVRALGTCAMFLQANNALMLEGRFLELA